MTTSSLPLPPGRLGLPWFGETLSFLRDTAAFAEEHRRSFGPVFKTHLFGRPTVFMGGVDAVRFVLTHDKDYFVVSWPRSTVRLLGEESLAVQDGARHQQLRKILQPVFGHKQLTAHVPLMDRIAREHTERWARGGALTLCPRLNQFTFHIACALILGDESDVAELTAVFQTLLAGLFSVAVALPGTPFARSLRARERLLGRLDALLRERSLRGASGEDALSVLLQATDERGEKLSRDMIKDLLITLLFAGYDTSASALSSFCMLTAQHPDVLARLRAEQEGLARDRDGQGGPLTLDRLKQMPYLEQVIKEVLRFIPPVGGGFRKVVTPCEFNGYQIPKGWGVNYSIATTHRMAPNFKDPDRFDPDRFGPDRAEDKEARFSWIPFGGGLRVCLGMEYARLELAVLGARLCHEYAWELEPGQDLTLTTVPTPRPKSGLRVRFRRR